MRIFVAVGVGVIYVACSALLVRREGDEYRRALNSAAAIPEASGKSTPVAAEPVPIPKPAPAEPIKVADHSDSLPIPKPAPTALAVNTSIPAKPSTPKPAANEEKGTTAVPPAPNLGLPRLSEILGEDRARKWWDLTRLTADDVRQIGIDLHSVIVRLHKVDSNDALQQRVDIVAERLCKEFGTKRLNVTILDSNEVNAFSHPGGYLYVSRGLLDAFGEDEDYALEFVVGHELAHLELHHAINCLWSMEERVKRETRRPLEFGTVQALYIFIIPRGYMVDDAVNHDFEADKWIYLKMKQQLQRSDRQCLKFLVKFVDYAKKYGFESGGKKPAENKELSVVENHYRAHVAAWKRLANLKKLKDGTVPPK